MKMSNLFALPIIWMLSTAAGAAELTINPGMWETTMTRTNPMEGDPITETNTECVKETTFNPSSMLEGTEGCRLVDEKLEGDKLSFKMECSMQGSQTLIDGSFQTDGQTGQGNMDLEISAGGVNMSMNMNWIANRLGDC